MEERPRDRSTASDPIRVRPGTAGAWIVGVDGSQGARHAALWAAANAPGRASSIRLTSAWGVPATTGGELCAPVPATPQIDGPEGIARDQVDRVAAEIAPGLDVPMEVIVACGTPASVLIGAADDGSLLVVGSRGRGGFSRLLLGSTGMQCATHADVPTVVVPGGSAIAGSAHLLVGIDGSANSLAALRWAVEFAEPGATIDCVSAWDVTPISVGDDRFFFPEASGLARERFEHQIDETVDASGRDDLNIERRFVEGRPRGVLADMADAVDLVVTGARGHGAIGAAILGSVSTWLLHHLRSPMVVVPGQRDRSGSTPAAAVRRG